MDNQLIAIVGMACRFPGAANLDQFWQHMLDGYDGIKTFCANNPCLSNEPSQRINKNTHDYHAGIIGQQTYFDRHFFGFSLLQACYLDPQYRWLLEIIWHALEDAGIPAKSLYGKRVGVYLGVGTPEYRITVNHYLQTHQNAEKTLPAMLCLDEHWIANYLSRVFGWHGQAIVINSGDNTTFSALELASKSLQSDEIEVAIIGTANMLSTTYMDALQQAKLLSQQGYCAGFDTNADGLVCSEGCGVIVLKRLRDIKRDKQEAYAIVKGYATDQSVIPHASAISWDAQGQQNVMNLALLHSAARLEDINYIEANGLGITAADEAEVNAMADFLHERSRKEKPCVIGSVKNHIGYLQNATGIASIIRGALILKNKIIPGNLHHIRVKDSLIAKHDDHKLMSMADKTLSVDERESPSCVLINGFDFFAHHHAVVLQEIRSTNNKMVTQIDEGHWRLFVVSAKSIEALHQLLLAYHSLIKNTSTLSLNDLCYSSQTTREHHSLRLAFLVQNLSELANLLQTALEQRQPSMFYMDDAACTNEEPRIKFLKRLAASYCQGLMVEFWSSNSSENAQKISLPLYPFHQQPCWIGDEGLVQSYSGENSVMDAKYEKELVKIKQKVINILAKHVNIPADNINPLENISSFYQESIQLVQFILLIKKQFFVDMPISIVQHDFTVLQLCENLLSAKSGQQRAIDTAQSEQEINLLMEAQHYVRDITPSKLIEKSAVVANNVLVTGATGYFGPFLLNELLQKTNCTIHCLVRGDGPEQAMQRLTENLVRYGLWHQENSSRLIALPGNIEKPLFGLDKSTYEKLANTIDSIYHCAGEINWLLPYQQLKAVNVIGTAETLKFAAYKKAKLMNYISTLGILMPLGHHHPSAITEDVDIDNFAKHPIGYYASKWVAEKMVQLLEQKSLPVNIFRPSFIGFYHQSQLVTMRHLFCEIISCCLELGCFPVYDGELQFIAPDVLAKEVVHLSFANHPLNKSVYHLNAQGILAWSTIYDLLTEQGITLNKLDYPDWKTLLIKESVKNKNLVKFLPIFFDLSTSFHQNLFEYYINKKPITTDVHVSALMPIETLNSKQVYKLYENYIKQVIGWYEAQRQR